MLLSCPLSGNSCLSDAHSYNDILRSLEASEQLALWWEEGFFRKPEESDGL